MENFPDEFADSVLKKRLKSVPIRCRNVVTAPLVGTSPNPLRFIYNLFVDRKPSASSIFVLTEPNKGCVKELPDLPYPLFATPV